MDESELANYCDENYFASFRLFAEKGAGAIQERDGVLAVASSVPIAFLNVAFVTRRLAQPEQALTAAADFFDGLGLPFVVRIREGADPAAEDAAAALGMPYVDTVPGMALFPIPAQPPPAASIEVGVVSDEAALARYQEVVAAGFGMPIDVARTLFTERMMGAPGVEFYLGSVDGHPVTTSALIRTGRVAGVYNVATLDSHRRRGLGEAMTWHAVQRGAAAGCDVAILQASEMGRPVYERMGFRLVAPYRTFHRPGH